MKKLFAGILIVISFALCGVVQANTLPVGLDLHVAWGTPQENILTEKTYADEVKGIKRYVVKKTWQTNRQTSLYFFKERLCGRTDIYTEGFKLLQFTIKKYKRKYGKPKKIKEGNTTSFVWCMKDNENPMKNTMLVMALKNLGKKEGAKYSMYRVKKDVFLHATFFVWFKQ